MREPEGVTLEDREGGQLRHDDRTFLVQDRGRLRVLALRVGRGTIRDATDDERAAAAWERVS